LRYNPKTVSPAKRLLIEAARTITSRERLKGIFRVSLYRNATYLILNSAVNAVAGFVFWIIAARLYSASDVGIGSALISMALLLSIIGTLGLDLGLIRFISTAKDKARLLNSTMTISVLTSIIIAFIFIAGIPLWSPELTFVREGPAFLAAFIILIVLANIDRFTQHIFIGFRRGGFVLSRGVILSVLKIAMVAALAFVFKSFGIPGSWLVAMAAVILVSIFLFIPKSLPGYRPVPSLQKQVTGEMMHFSLANYAATVLQNASSGILPLMVVSILGAQESAYFYIPWAITTALLAVPTGTSFALFAEGSHDEGKLGAYLVRTIGLTALIIIPILLILFLLGDKLLLLFGGEYSTAGTHLLWVLAAAIVPATFNLLYLGKIRVQKKLKEIIAITAAMNLGTLLLSYFLMPHMGIIGVGAGWLASQAIVAIVLIFRAVRKRSPSHELKQV